MERSDLLGKFLTLTDNVGVHNNSCCVLLVLFVLDKAVNTVESNTAIVADNSSSAVSVGKSCDDMI